MSDTVDPLVKAMNRAAMKASRNAIIEECARVAEARLEDHSDPSLAEWIGAVIRALKDKP